MIFQEIVSILKDNNYRVNSFYHWPDIPNMFNLIKKTKNLALKKQLIKLLIGLFINILILIGVFITIIYLVISTKDNIII